MAFVVYILQSEKNHRYYVGHTENLERRISEHNSCKSLSTKHGVPWKVLHLERYQNRREAMTKEIVIKKRGIARYLKDIGMSG